MVKLMDFGMAMGSRFPKLTAIAKGFHLGFEMGWHSPIGWVIGSDFEMDWCLGW